MTGVRLNPSLLHNISKDSLQVSRPTLSHVNSCHTQCLSLTTRQSPAQRQLSLFRHRAFSLLCARARRIQTSVQTDDQRHTIHSCKLKLQEELDGTKRGIFGLKASKSEAIDQLLNELELTANEQRPTEHVDQLKGTWHLLYTSLVIKGARKTKLGLREFVSLGDFEQIIDPDSKLATNKVHFAVTGLGNLSGSLTIIAKFEAISAKRVQIKFESAKLVPKPLEQLFAGNYDLLLSIFNPEGWLDITYFDGTHRIGRDDKGNVFYLQRA